MRAQPHHGFVLTGGDLDPVLGLLHLRGSNQFTSPRTSGKSEPAAQGLSAHQQYQPILDKDSPLYRKVREAGWEVTEDGWEVRLRLAKSALAFLTADQLASREFFLNRLPCGER